MNMVRLEHYLVLLHICCTSASLTRPRYLRCYGRLMDKLLCLEGTFINIHHAFYADNGAFTSCNDDKTPNNLCTADISEVNPTYHAEILRKCNGRRGCKDLVAKKTSTDNCNGWFNQETDYVWLEYTCDMVTTTTQTTTTQTEVTSHSLSTSAVSGSGVTPDNNTSFTVIVPMETPRPHTGENSNLGLAVAIPLVIVVIIIIIIVLLLFLRNRRRRRSQSKGGDENGAAHTTTYANALYTTADHGDVIYDRAATVVLTRPEDSLPPYVDMNARSTSGRGSSKRKMRLSWRKPSTKSSKKGKASGSVTSDPVDAGISVEKPIEQTPSEQQDPDRERIYSLEKVPSEDRPESPDVYQSYDPYVEAGDSEAKDRLSAPPVDRIPQYMAMDKPQTRHDSRKESDAYSEVGQSTKLEDMEGVYSVPGDTLKTRVVRKESDPYTDVGQPSKLEDIEGVYSVPRNSDRVCSLTDEPRTPSDAPRSPPPYENVYQETGVPRSPAKPRPQARPRPRPRVQSAEYSEVGAPRPVDQGPEYSEVAPRRPAPAEAQYGNIARPGDSTVLVDNPVYSN